MPFGDCPPGHVPQVRPNRRAGYDQIKRPVLTAARIGRCRVNTTALYSLSIYLRQHKAQDGRDRDCRVSHNATK
jgi:hypothetical protein